MLSLFIYLFFLKGICLLLSVRSIPATFSKPCFSCALNNASIHMNMIKEHFKKNCTPWKSKGFTRWAWICIRSVLKHTTKFWSNHSRFSVQISFLGFSIVVNFNALLSLLLFCFFSAEWNSFFSFLTYSLTTWFYLIEQVKYPTVWSESSLIQLIYKKLLFKNKGTPWLLPTRSCVHM